MAKANETPSPADSPLKIWGVSPETWAKLFQQVGISTIMLCVILWVFYQSVPALLSAHIELLRQTAKTMESVEVGLAQSNRIMAKLEDQQYPAKDFRDQVGSEHAEAQVTLDELKAATDKVSAQLQKIQEGIDKLGAQ